MDASDSFVIRFDGASAADGNRYADDLRESIVRSVPEAEVARQKDDAESQDFGATLIVVLGTPAVIALAHAIHAWLARNNAASIRVETRDGTIIAKNLESRDVADVVKALQRRK